jgi:tRNA-splicing ligase RtcB
MSWKSAVKDSGRGYYTLHTQEIGSVPVRLFLTPNLLDQVEESIYPQIVNAASFPGVKLVAITPDVHHGYGVPIGTVLLTDAEIGAVAMGPVGFDIGCFTGDTRVPTLGGPRTLRELAETGGEHWIFSLSTEQQIVAAKATAQLTRRAAALLRVTLDDGAVINCTPDHLFMLRDESWSEARSLSPGTSLMPLKQSVAGNGARGFGINNHRRWLHGFNHKVASVEVLERHEDVYCLTVPEYGNFALEAGVFVHNCGMMSASSDVPVAAATPENRLRFNREVTRRVALGPGKVSHTRLKSLTQKQFEAIIRGGAAYYAQHYGERVDRTRAERDRLPVDDAWQPPWGGQGRPERGVPQLGTLGGGNHFIELQGNVGSDTLYVQLHSGSRGFGHGLATNYFQLAKEENPAIKALDLGYFTPESAHYRDYLNAVAAGGNFAIVNRLAMFEQIAMAFQEVFGKPLSLVYEISHNLVQREHHPEFGWVHVHRKGATRAFPASYDDPQAGHPILIPGSNRDSSFILRAADQAHLSGYSVNHGSGRRMSRTAARKGLKQDEVNAAYREAGIVVNTDGVVPIDESKDAYKSSREVVEAVTRAGLATIEHELMPLASIKGTE